MSENYAKGVYQITILDVGMGESAEKKTPMIEFKVKIDGKVEKNESDEDVVYACEDQGLRTIKEYVTEKTMEFLPEKLRQAGWNGDDFDNIKEMIGLTCFATCDHETAKEGKSIGKTFDRFSLGVPTMRPVEHNTSIAKKLNALFGKNLKSAKPKERVAPSAPVAATTAAFDDRESDLPF